jgi:hypothetical protein
MFISLVLAIGIILIFYTDIVYATMPNPNLESFDHLFVNDPDPGQIVQDESNEEISI